MLRHAPVLLILALLLGCSVTDETSLPGQVAPESEAEIVQGITGQAPPPGKALLVFYRPPRFAGSANDYSVWIDETRVGVLNFGSNLTHVADPGVVSIRIKTVPNPFNIGLGLLVMRTGPVDARVEAGRIHFFEVGDDIFVGGPLLETTDRNRALAQLSQTKPARGTAAAATAPREPGILVPLGAGASTAASAAPPRRPIAGVAITDSRPDPSRIGERFAAFGVKMGNVYAARPVPEFIRTAVASRLGAPETPTTPVTEGDVLEIRLERFWFDTDTTPLHWDIVGEVSLTAVIGTGSEQEAQSFRCDATERTYTDPSVTVFRTVIERCMGQLLSRIADWDALAPPVLARSG